MQQDLSMKKHILLQTNVETSRLGFGCVQLTAHHNHGAAMVKAGIFTPEAAIRSLETSLRELGTDYVDIFLLHEGTLADASSAPLVETLLS
jgi:aryl-alcohol dehydrogenase-like predicted oxidoreductase